MKSVSLGIFFFVLFFSGVSNAEMDSRLKEAESNPQREEKIGEEKTGGEKISKPSMEKSLKRERLLIPKAVKEILELDLAPLEKDLYVYHLETVANVPKEFSSQMYQAALDIGEDPYDLAALLISEHSGPDMDFSWEGSQEYSYEFQYQTDSVGSAGELGLFQLMPRWVTLAAEFYGTNWTSEDLLNPEVNIRAAAFVLHTLRESHQKCEKRTYNYHDWPAHYKCSRTSRDVIDPSNRCRWSQKKFEKLRYSLSQEDKPDLKAMGEAHNKRMASLKDKETRSFKRTQKKRLEALRKEAEIEPAKSPKEMSIEEIEGEIQELEWAL